MSVKKWVILEEIDVPDSKDQLVISYWPHEYPGGNHEGEHWVHVNHNNGEYSTALESHHFWNKNARYRAYKHLRKMMEHRNIDPQDYSIPSFKEISLREQVALIEMEDFIDMVERKVLVDSDGIGEYANEDWRSDIDIKPSDDIDESWTHVFWYNK